MNKAEAEALLDEYANAIRQYRHTGERIARRNLMQALTGDWFRHKLSLFSNGFFQSLGFSCGILFFLWILKWMEIVK